MTPSVLGAGRAQGAMAQLDHDQLLSSHTETLAAPLRRYGLGARVLFAVLDLVYGKVRTLSKFKVLELVARVPYQAWEQVAYIAITHTHDSPGFARRIFDRVTESRGQEDNEQWHLLILEELIVTEGTREGWVRFTFFPQALAFVYYQLSWLLYVIRPAWSYQLNADFEDHAEHEYALLVDEHPEWEHRPFDAFHSGGLDLWVTGTRQQVGRKRLEASGELRFIATWPYETDAGALFNQGEVDLFNELGEEGDEDGQADAADL